MNCDDVRELLAGYALGALSDEERLAVAVHLEECDLHADLEDWRATVESLAGLADEVAPPAELRARVLAVASRPIAATSAPSATPAEPIALRTRRRSPFPAYLGWAVAAVFATIALVAVLRPPSADVPREVVTREGGAAAGAAHAIVTYAPDEQRVVFQVDHLVPPPVGHEYQLWVVRGQTPVSLGVFVTTADGVGSMVAQSRLSPGEVVAVTVEPVGGSPAPTTQPFLAITY